MANKRKEGKGRGGEGGPGIEPSLGATLSARICCGSWPWGRYTKPTRKIEYENRSRENKLAIFYAPLSPFVVIFVVFVVVGGGAAVVFSRVVYLGALFSNSVFSTMHSVLFVQLNFNFVLLGRGESARGK